MGKATPSRLNARTILLTIGIFLLFISPLVWMLIPQLFSDALCNPGPTGNGCGYANAGMNAYAFFGAAAVFAIGTLLVVASWIMNTAKKSARDFPWEFAALIILSVLIITVIIWQASIVPGKSELYPGS